MAYNNSNTSKDIQTKVSNGDGEPKNDFRMWVIFDNNQQICNYSLKIEYMLYFFREIKLFI